MTVDADFLPYYLKEISRLRTAGSAFAQQYTDLAGALDFQSAETDDPQIARLIDSFAFLTAKLQQQFDAQFPQIPTALLEALYPQLVSPIPSMAIAQFKVAAKQDRAIEGIVVPRETAIFATTATGAECRFRTGFDLPIWPVEVSAAQLQSPADLTFLDEQRDVHCCLRITLKCVGEKRSFADFSPATLRFYIDGDRNSRFRLFELLCNNLIEVVTFPTGGGPDEEPGSAPGLNVRPIGLDPEEAILPYPAASHHGYRLLQEYFHFPDKFMFVELGGISTGMLGAMHEIDLLFLLNAEPAERVSVDATSLRLGCVPIANLFHQTSEPIRLDHLSVDYLLEPDIRAASTTEVHSVLGVNRSAAGTDQADAIQPYFDPHPDGEQHGALRWLARRHPVANPAVGGTEVQLSFVDPALNPMVPAEDVLFAQLLCTNRGLARQVTPMTGFDIEADLPLDRIRCLAKPSLPVDPPMAGESLWRLVSHLSPNKLTLRGGEDNPPALKQILFLYSGEDENSRKRRQIDGIDSLRTRSIVRRIGDRQWRGFIRGTEIILTFKEENFVSSSAFLLGSVLDRFFALYAGVNSFTELVIRRTNLEEDWKRWPARAGDRQII